MQPVVSVKEEAGGFKFAGDEGEALVFGFQLVVIRQGFVWGLAVVAVAEVAGKVVRGAAGAQVACLLDQRPCPVFFWGVAGAA